MSGEERAQYRSMFATADEDQDGFVGGKEAKKFFKQSQVDNKTLGQVWLLADVDKDNKLNIEEFAIAMHLVMKLRKKVPLPPTLPDALLPGRQSAGGGGGGGGGGGMMGGLDPLPTSNNRAPSLDDFGPPINSSAPPAMQQSMAPPQQQQFTQGGPGAFQPPQQTGPPPPATNFFPGGSAAAFLNSPEDEMEKYRQLNRTLSTAQSATARAGDQLKGLEQTLSLYSKKFQLLVEQVDKTGVEFDHINRLIAEEQAKIEAKKAEMARMDEENGGALSKIEEARQQHIAKQQELKDLQQKIIDAHTSMPAIKKETGELDMQIAMMESQLTQMRQQWKQQEDMKTAQLSILQARKDQAGKILREKAEVQEMLDQAQLELSKLKQEGNMVKDNLPILQSSVQDMRGNLKELQELVEEEKKNPSVRTDVQFGANGQLMLGKAPPPPKPAAPPASQGAKSGSLGGGKMSAAALGLDDDDDDFAVPDIQMPGQGGPPKPAPPPAGAPPPLPSAAPSAAAAKKSLLPGFDDDDDAFAVPDFNVPTPATATAAKPAAAASAFDDFGDFGDGPGAAPSKPAAASSSSSSALDAFGDSDWGADPFGGASSSSTSKPPAAAPPSLGGFGDSFGGGADPFGADPFAPVAAASPKPQPPAPAPAGPPALSRPGSLPQPPPPPPGAAPPTPKVGSATSTPPKSPSGPPPPAPKPAAAAVAALAGFDDDGWDVPAGVAGSENVKGEGWGAQDAAAHDDWGF